MSDIIRIDELEDAEPLSSGDFKVIFQPSSGGDRREKKQDALTQNPRSFISGRLDSQELVSGSLSVSGWYTIAESEAIAFIGASANFTLASTGSARSSIINFLTMVFGSGGIKDFANNKIEILGRSNSTTGTSNFAFESIRIVKSDSVNNSGFKLQAKLSIATTVNFNTLISQNCGITGKGWELVDPYLDNTPTLPDGVTVGTFLEAGAELSLSNETVDIPTAKKGSSDVLHCSVMLPFIPKQGTGLSLTLPSTSLSTADGNGVTINVTAAHTISNFVIDGNIINFRINETGAFATLNFGPISVFWLGTGGKLTIT